jgi:hypothetical protein
MENHQELEYLKKIISLQDKLLDCYESDSDTELEGEGELSYVKKIASLQTKVLESYETDSDDDDDLEKSVYHDSSFSLSPGLYEYLGEECPMFPDRSSVITAIVHKLKNEKLVDSDNNVSLLNPAAKGLVSLFTESVQKEDSVPIFSIVKHLEHHFNG